MQGGVGVLDREMQSSLKAVLEVTKTAWTQNEFPLAWATEVSICIHNHGLGMPSVELSQVLVHCLAMAGSASNTPGAATIWTYIQHAMSSQMVSALHMLALLTSRSICLLSPRSRSFLLKTSFDFPSRLAHFEPLLVGFSVAAVLMLRKFLSVFGCHSFVA